VAEKLTKEMKADGIVCGNDYTAALLMKTLITAGVRIPDQIKLTGVDNLKYAQLLNIPLTTLAQPCREIGLASLEMMRFRLEQPSALPRQLLFDAPLIIRESTGLGDSRTPRRKPTDTSQL
jgi:DNA-binding LacI/PurR family transcriptional regulator